MEAIKVEIQALENTWATAANGKDVATIVNFYADNAVSSAPNQPILVGKAAIRKEIGEELEKRKDIRTVTFETRDVYGDGTVVTEMGKTTARDAKGTVAYTGKYMDVWENAMANGWSCGICPAAM